jgi:hypothetical protein
MHATQALQTCARFDAARTIRGVRPQFRRFTSALIPRESRDAERETVASPLLWFGKR